MEEAKAVHSIIQEWNTHQDLLPSKIGKYELEVSDYIVREHSGELNQYTKFNLVLRTAPVHELTYTKILIYHRSYQNLSDRDIPYRELLREIFMGGLFNLWNVRKELKEKESGVR